jgi:hypothetical protein
MNDPVLLYSSFIKYIINNSWRKHKQHHNRVGGDFVGLDNVDFENYFANVNEFINIVDSASASRFLSDKALLNEGCQGDINTGFFL